MGTSSSEVPTLVGRRTPKGDVRRSDRLTGLAFVAPGLILYGAFVLYPLIQSVYVSFTSWDGVSPTKPFVGLDNYRAMFHDDLFWTSLKHNITWLVVATFVPIVLGLFLAVLASGARRFRTVYRVGFFLPFILAPSAVTAIWSWIYDPTIGVLNNALEAIGLGDLTQGWLGDPNIALYCVAFCGLWAGTGFSFVVFMAALQDVDPETRDAAVVDGAGPFRLFWHITMPQLRHSIRFLVLLSLIFGFAAFELVFLLTGGGPGNSTELLGTYAYRVAFQFGHVGYGTALTTVMAVLALVCSVVYLQFQKWQDRNA